jgi:hypothetical protein
MTVKSEDEMQKQNICNAGEYYIASVLSAENFITTITLGRAEKYDILALNPSGKMFKISVKTRFQEKADRFILSEVENSADNYFYAFVCLNEFKSQPQFWIVPSDRVKKIISIAHKDFLNKKNRKGEYHKDSKIRNFWVIKKVTYPEGWEEELEKYKGKTGIEQMK